LNALLYGFIKMKLSVIIVNYNVKYFLEQCLHSVLRAAKGIDAEVLVIDNASTDGSLEYLQPLFPAVNFIRSKINRGFGKANNAALAEATGEFILFLNPDTIVAEDCFSKCINFLEINAKAGALGVRMLDGSGIFLPESKRSFPTTSTAFFKAVGLSSLFPTSKTFNKYSLGYLGDKDNHVVDVLAGAFFLTRKTLLDETSGFDEQFFMYGEDIDLSYRLKQTGFDNWYFAETSIIHFKGESLKKWSADHVKAFYEAMIVFVKKHYRGNGAGLLRLLLLFGIKSKSFLSLLKGYFSAKTKKAQDNKVRTIVLGKKADIIACRRIYEACLKEDIIVDEFQFTSFTSAAELDLECQQRNIKQMIFCSSLCSYQLMISIVGQLNQRYLYRFHFSGSKSIIGSSNRSNTGEALHVN
jgi:GT2 family glycosyltransferase